MHSEPCSRLKLTVLDLTTVEDFREMVDQGVNEQRSSLQPLSIKKKEERKERHTYSIKNTVCQLI